jgi:two-component system CheB/CheR fusion protein
MYFNREAQDRVLARFHFALREHGWLFLGNAEMLLTRRNLFTPIDARSRIFQKVTKHSLEERVALMDQTRADPGGEPTPLRPQLRDLVFDASPVPQIVVSRGGTIVLINATARQQFGLARQDEGRPLHELEISYRPVELRSLLDQLFVEGRPVSVHGVERHVSESRSQYHDVKLTPITDLRGSVIAATIVFVDVTHDHELRTELEHSRRDLELAYEELQSANEELETTNEELQSTIEELETTNEELQSTNEELETMNEELQSTNEELGAVNDELRERTEAITRLNAYMRSILNSARPGVVVVNEDLRVHLWNSRATDLWGLRPDEVENQPVLNLDIGLPIAELKDAMRACLRGEEDLEPLVLAAHDRRGKALQCRVTCAPLLGPGEDVSGVILMMEEWSGDGAGPEGGS